MRKHFGFDSLDLALGTAWPRLPGFREIRALITRAPLPGASGKPRMPVWSGGSGVPRDRNKNEASTARRTGDSIGNAYSLRTKTRVAPVWPWTRTIRAFCLRACGNWRCTPGENLAVDQGAPSTYPKTAGPRGPSLRATDCREPP